MASLAEFYLSRRPEFRRPGALLEALTRRLGSPPPFPAGALAQCIAEDFEADRLVIHKGRVFAEMEARLMAQLAALGPPVG